MAIKTPNKPSNHSALLLEKLELRLKARQPKLEARLSKSGQGSGSARSRKLKARWARSSTNSGLLHPYSLLAVKKEKKSENFQVQNLPSPTDIPSKMELFPEPLTPDKMLIFGFGSISNFWCVMKSFSSTLTIAPFLKFISEPCLSDVCGDPYPFFSFLRGHSGLRLSVGRLFDGGGMLVEKTDRIFEKFSTSFSSSFSSDVQFRVLLLIG